MAARRGKLACLRQTRAVRFGSPPTHSSTTTNRGRDRAYRMNQVNSRGESWLSARHSSPAPTAAGEQPAAETPELPSFSGPIVEQRECRPKVSWRRERNCRQTLSEPISMGYEPHKFQCMLTGESLNSCRRVPERPPASVAVRLTRASGPLRPPLSATRTSSVRSSSGRRDRNRWRPEGGTASR
jgi:hypothetical protein